MKTIIVGVSGGLDSMVLLDKLYKQGKKLVVAHVNYQKRDDSYIDIQCIKDYIKDKDIILENILIPKDYSYTDNFQKQARLLRYDFYLDIANKYQTNLLYLGHHKDDFLETYLFQKDRQGLVNYYGIAKYSNYQELIVVRPLIDEYKQELLDYSIINHIPYHEDSSNQELTYTRNIIRSKLNSYSITDKNNLYNQALQDNLELKKEIFQTLKETRCVYTIEDFNKLDKSIKRRLIFNHVKDYQMTLKYIDEILRVLEVSKSVTYEFLNTFIQRSYDTIYLLSFSDLNYTILINNEISLQNIKKHFKVKYNFDIIIGNSEYPFIIRNLDNKDISILVNDIKKHRKLMKNKKVPKYLQDHLPVIEKDGEVVGFAFKL